MNPKSLFVDTSGWAEPLLRNTPDHVAMVVYSRQLTKSRRPIITTNFILSELVALLTSRAARVPRPDNLDFIENIRQMPQLHLIHVDEATDAEGWAMLRQYADKDWSHVDAVSFVLMRRLGLLEAFTSDEHFTQAGFLRVPRLP
jgi:predicted nucleic acid-binding protein